MAGQLIPPPGLEPSLPEGLTFSQRLEAWVDLMNASEAILRSGLRRRHGPNADIDSLMRDWYRTQMDERDRWKIDMLRRTSRR